MYPYREIRTVKVQGVRVGFTLVEIIIVVVIIGIAAMVVVPMMNSAAGMQIKSAANMIAADMEYAKSMAISRQQYYSVVFNITEDRYEIHDAGGSVIRHPVKKGFDYVVDFRGDSRLDRVDIAAANFDSTSEVKFDYLGSPYDSGGSPLNSGIVTLETGDFSITISVEPMTGFISITD